MTGWHCWTSAEAAEAIRNRALSPVELTQAMLDRVGRIDSSLHSVATVAPDFAMAAARRVEQEIAAGHYCGPLHGVPIAVKDICDIAGIVAAATMPIYARRVPETGAKVVSRLVAVGAVLLGKLQLIEGAFAKHHPDVAAPRNPWNADYYSGASSSGSGVTAAAGLAFATIGSDTGGSTRFPAAASGITGLKPAWGRVSRHGIFPLAPSLDHIGPLTRSAADAGVVLGAIAGSDPNDRTLLAAPVPDFLAGLEHGMRGVSIGIVRFYNENDVDADVASALRAALVVFQDLGATVHEVRLSDRATVTAGWGSLAGVFGTADLLLIPTQPLADFTIAAETELFARPDDLTAFLRLVVLFDMSGNPTITLPGGFTAKRLPLSFQLVARPLEEARLVQAGHAYQQATAWHRRHPSL